MIGHNTVKFLNCFVISRDHRAGATQPVAYLNSITLKESSQFSWVDAAPMEIQN